MFCKRFLLTFVIISNGLFAQTIPVNHSFSTYWQQKADCKMDIDIDTKKFQYRGKQTLTYTNNSPDDLDEIYYHLYYNAFQPGSEMDLRLQTISDPDGRMVNVTKDISKPNYESKIAILKPDEIGFIKVNNLTQNGIPLHFKVEGTVLEVNLAKIIKSGETCVFEMEFEAQIPKMIRRGGRNSDDGVSLSMTQWYPKIAVYDSEGWHTDPYIMREFYGEWGNYDVTLHLDKKYVVAGTGYLQNPQEVGCGYENPNLTLQIPPSDKKTWHFFAPNVHDFTWVGDPDYQHDTLMTKDGITLHFLYKNNGQNWKDLQPYAVKTMEFYNNLLGKYPYQQYSVIQGGDGGMEYGMCTLISGGKRLNGLISAMIHEMGHAWFQFSLANNETKHPWMDEGFTTFVETLAKQNIHFNLPDFPFQEEYEAYFYMVHSEQEEPLTTHSDRYFTNTSYGINAYYKGSVFLGQLSYLIGWENLMQTLKEYYRQWSGKHPTPTDFIRVAEKVSGLHLDWYLNEFIQTTHTVDLGVQIVSDYGVEISRIGEIPMPVDIEIIFEDDSKQNYYIPLNIMRGEKPTEAIVLKDWGWAQTKYFFKTDKKIKSVQLDTSKFMADIDRSNNLALR